MGTKTIRRMVYAGALCACWILPGCLTADWAAAQDQSAPATADMETGQAALDAEQDKIVTLEYRPAAQMSPEDKSLIDQKRREIGREAAFFGYDFGSGDWTYDQVVCPDMPEDVILHFRSRSRAGAESLFTAIVPREAGRVFVVPVLFRNATPFHGAAGSERSIAVFNQAVPKEMAEKAAQADGPWLSLGMCYAAIAGAEPQVPERTNTDIALVRAPVPTMRMSSDNGIREILFSDRNNPGQYVVWSITLTGHGRVTAASARTFSDYKAQTASEQNPAEKVVHPGPEPPGKVVQPEKQPQETQIPQ